LKNVDKLKFGDKVIFLGESDQFLQRGSTLTFEGACDKEEAAFLGYSRIRASNGVCWLITNSSIVPDSKLVKALYGFEEEV